MLYYTIKFISQLVSVLPKDVRMTIGNLLGEICWLIVPKKRKRMAEENILRSLKVNAREARRIAKISATRFGRMFMEVLFMPNLNKENISQYVVEVRGKEYLEQALNYGRGAVLATAHTGNWELLGAALAIFKFPIVGVAQKQTNEQMDRLINEYRTSSGMHITYKTGVREMVKLLGEGRIIGLLMDQDAHDGVMIPFFGRLASTPPGSAALARMKEAPIVPTFISEKAPGQHVMIVHPPVWVEKTGDRDADILSTTTQLTNIIEEHIRQHPEEWFWLHNRWKHSPE